MVKRTKHRKFIDFLSDKEYEHRDAPCYKEINWLIRGWMLKSVRDLKSETELFLEMEGKYIPHLCDHD
jgi:hypothetical protein